jgi:hypothetical protein
LNLQTKTSPLIKIHLKYKSSYFKKQYNKGMNSITPFVSTFNFNGKKMWNMKNKALYYWTGVLQLFVGIGAVVSGLALILDQDGSNLSMSVELLKESPFEDFLIPGIALLSINGLGSILGSLFSFRCYLLAGKMAMILGVAMIIWISAQVYWIGWISWLQPVYFVLGIIEGVLGFFIVRNSRS